MSAKMLLTPVKHHSIFICFVYLPNGNNFRLCGMHCDIFVVCLMFYEIRQRICCSRESSVGVLVDIS